MNFELDRADPRQRQGIINLGFIMDRRVRRTVDRNVEYSRKMGSEPGQSAEGKFHRQKSAKRLFPASGYFSLESLYLLICLTMSLLILPLILPPLPPPPFMLLLLPIVILVVLVVLAFMPTNVRDLTSTYV
ncbi:protein AUXIN-REGULATED GENE INVOLVED IN ORGAN SIZE-like [Eucalyptus grandis]|uniref:protein AUXIN-REGULATED GENE INVOLVED IN ORGAN SIZE-like n=1 Tax=Eucalyptus grandis TaxID=71139 RepID=UPI00192EFFC7|nr:protein AUXIN-REGULATED GENE INVOLVED IN ORGAN SIZE-like [Eucalyptus grandis]